MQGSITYPGFRWYYLAMTVVAILAQGMILIAPTPLVGEIAGELGSDLGIVTAAMMMPFTLCVALGGVVAGFLMDRIGIVKTFLLGTALSTVAALALPYFGGSLGAIVLLRALQGIGCGPLNASGPKLAAEWFPPHQRGLVQGIFGATLSLGITVGLMVGPSIAHATGDWKMSVFAFGFVMALAFVMILLTRFGPSTPNAMSESVATSADMRRVYATPLFWATVAATFALSWVMQGYNDLTPGHLAVPPPAGLGLGAQAAGMIMGLYTLAFALGSAISGVIVEKVFHRRYGLVVTITFLITAVLCFLVMVPSVASTALLPVLLLAGFFMGFPMATSQTSISNYYPEQLQGRVGGVTMGLAVLGGTAGVAAGSAALHATGAYFVSVVIVCVVCLFGAIAGFGIRRPASVPEPAPQPSTVLQP